MYKKGGCFCASSFHYIRLLFIALQFQSVCYAVRKLFLVVRNHNERFVSALAESLYDVLHTLTVFAVKTMKRFVQNQQFGVFYESPCQKTQALLAAAQFQEGAVGNVFYAENLHPLLAYLPLLRRGTEI